MTRIKFVAPKKATRREPVSRLRLGSRLDPQATEQWKAAKSVKLPNCGQTDSEQQANERDGGRRGYNPINPIASFPVGVTDPCRKPI
jgi:hypothetical protein